MKIKIHSMVSIIFISLCFLVFSISSAPATLIDLGNGVTKDDKDTLTPFDDQYWIQDLNRFVGMTYDEQITAISNLDNQGLSGITAWHMATYSDILTLWNFYEIQEIAESFVPTRVGIPGEPDYRHWNGRYDRILPNFPRGGHYEVNMSYRYGEYSGGINIGVADSEVFPGAFATAYALPAPEPYEFSELTITKAKVKFEDGLNNDNFKINGEFILSESSNGIAPVIEDVEISVGTSRLLIPANSFVEKKNGKYEFLGNVYGANVRMRIVATDVDTYIFVIDAEGVDLSDTFNPVNIELLIGDDSGAIDLRLKGILSL